MALAKHTERIDRLEEVNDQNTAAFIDSIKMLEVQVNVMRGVVEELYKERHGNLAVIDWAARTSAYLTELAKREEAAPAIVPAPTHVDEEVVVFGGNGV